MNLKEPQAPEPHWMNEPDQWRTFAFYSANLQCLMPGVPLEQHKAYFEQTQRLQDFNSLNNSLEQLDLLKDAKWADGISAPGIVATFHMGPYHLVCGWLMRQGIPFSLVLSDDIFQHKAASYSRLYREVTGCATSSEDFGLINAANPHSLFQMRRAMMKGHLLLVYVDGNTGVRDQSGLPLNFLDGTLRVKTGVAYLSYLMQCQVYPVLCHWEEKRAQWKAAEPILPYAGESRQQYVQRCMTVVYGLLADSLPQYTPQWEGWKYVHHDIHAGDGKPNRRKLDRHMPVTQFMPFTLGSATFLLERKRLQAYPIPAQVYRRVLSDAKIFFCN